MRLAPHPPARLTGLLTRLPARLRAVTADTRGTFTVEAVLVLPLVIWAYVAGVAFFDSFRAQNTNVKAAYLIADMVSRQVEPMSPAHIEGLNLLYDRLARARHPTMIRVTNIDWDIAAEDYRVRWSYGTNDFAPLSNIDLVDLQDRLPELAPGESFILVQTLMQYKPVINFGTGVADLSHFITVRPRFAPNIGFTS